MLNSFDQNHDGKFDREEVSAMVTLMIQEEKKIQSLKTLVIFIIALAIGASLLVFGLVVGANEASKESHISASDTNEFGDVSLMTDKDGKPVATVTIETPTTLYDLFELPSELLDKLDKLSFRTPANPGDMNCQLDLPVTEYTVAVMGYTRNFDDNDNFLDLEIITGYTTTGSGEPLVVHFEPKGVMFVTEGREGVRKPVCPDDGESALATDSTGRRRLRSVLEQEEEEAMAMEVDASGTSRDSRKLARADRKQRRKNRRSTIARAVVTITAKTFDKVVNFERPRLFPTDEPTPAPTAASSLVLKKDYNFVAKFAFDVYAETCEGKRSTDGLGYCNDMTTWSKEAELFDTSENPGGAWCSALNAKIVKFFNADGSLFPNLWDGMPDAGTQGALYKVEGEDVWVLAWRGSEGMGHCTSRVSEDGGWNDPLGLVPMLAKKGGKKLGSAVAAAALGTVAGPWGTVAGFVGGWIGGKAADRIVRGPTNCVEEFLDDFLYADARSFAVKEQICPANTATTGRMSKLKEKFNSPKRVHKGFYQAWMSVRETVRSTLEAELSETSTLYITGHSLGGALATLCGYDYTCNKVHGITPKIITFASPAVFKTREQFEAVVKPDHYLRVVTEDPTGGLSSATSEKINDDSCADDPAWRYAESKHCKWTKGMAYRCSRKDPATGIKGNEACPKSCGKCDGGRFDMDGNSFGASTDFGMKDIVVSSYTLLGYEHPIYPALSITPPDVATKNCMLGACHPIETNYINTDLVGNSAYENAMCTGSDSALIVAGKVCGLSNKQETNFAYEPSEINYPDRQQCPVERSPDPSTEEQTGWNSIGGGDGDIFYLDRHTADCAGNGVMGQHQYVMEGPPAAKFLAVSFTCGKPSGTATANCEDKSTQFSGAGTDKSEIIFLDRHALDCGSKYLSRVHMASQSYGGDIRYDYRCCDLGSAEANYHQMECETKITPPHSGKTFSTLAQLDMQCSVNTYLKKFQLHTSGLGLHYEYTCCTPTSEFTSALVADGKACKATSGDWKGTQLNLDQCRDAVLADSDCGNDYFEYTNTDGNCKCASTASENIDCSQSANQDDESIMQIYKISSAPTPSGDGKWYACGDPNCVHQRSCGTNLGMNSCACEQPGIPWKTNIPAFHELVADGKSCKATSGDWKGTQLNLDQCRAAVLADSDCGNDYFEYTNTDGNCKCASTASENIDCSQSANQDADTIMQIYKISSGIDQCRAAVIADATCDHRFFEMSNDGKCRCALNAGDPTDCSHAISWTDVANTNIYRIRGAPTPAPTPGPPTPAPAGLTDYNFAAKFAFDIYAEHCQGKRSSDGDGYCNEMTSWPQETAYFPLTDNNYNPTGGQWCSGVNAKIVKFFEGNAGLFGGSDPFMGLAAQGTQGALYKVEGEDVWVLAWRGSEGLGSRLGLANCEGKINCMQEFIDDWLLTDVRGRPVKDEFCPNNPYNAADGRPLPRLNPFKGQKIHMGFSRAWGSVNYDVRATLKEKLSPSSTLYITGHSLGGALATLSGYELTCNKVHDITPKIITLASPAVFQNNLRFEQIVKQDHYLRVVARDPRGVEDIVTSVGGYFAYQQPVYGPLFIEVGDTPESSPGYWDPRNALAIDKICESGMCHVIEYNYMTSDLVENSDFQNGLCTGSDFSLVRDQFTCQGNCDDSGLAWKGAGGTAAECRSAVLADSNCDHAFFEFAEDGNCRCALPVGDSTDCTLTTHQRFDDSKALYRITKAPHRLVGNEHACRQHYNSNKPLWMGVMSLPECRDAVVGDVTCAHDFFEFKTDGRCRCATLADDTTDCLQEDYQAYDSTVQIYQIL
jgi:esterase/lipase